MPRWLQILSVFGPQILALIPATQKIAGVVAAGIAAAEQIPAAKGPDKKAAVLQLATLAVAGVNVQADKQVLDPQPTLDLASQAIDTVIAVVNLLHSKSEAPVVAVVPAA